MEPIIAPDFAVSYGVALCERAAGAHDYYDMKRIRALVGAALAATGHTLSAVAGAAPARDRDALEEAITQFRRGLGVLSVTAGDDDLRALVDHAHECTLRSVREMIARRDDVAEVIHLRPAGRR